MEKTTLKIIETKDIPEPKKLQGNTSKVPAILKQIPRGKSAIIENPKEAQTIRNYLTTKHQKGEELDYTIKQRKTENGTIQYLTHETTKIEKPTPKIKNKKPATTDIPLPPDKLPENH